MPNPDFAPPSEPVRDVPELMPRPSTGSRLVLLVMRYHFPVLIAVISSIITLGFGILAFEVLSKATAAWPGIYSRWDTSHYEAIARLGYDSSSERGYHICFFPLFPLLAAPLVPLLGNATLALLIVANLSCIAGFLCFHRLARLEYGNDVARIALVALAIFPTSYFFHLGYTESLSLAASAAAFLAARKQFWAWAGLFAFLASLSRLTGIVLVPALLIEYFQQSNFQFRRIRPSVLFALTPFAGLGIYLGLNQILFGNPLRFLAFQSAVFSKRLDWPWVGFLNEWNSIWTTDPVSRTMTCGANIFAFVLGTTMLLFALWKLRPCYSIYVLGLWVLTFCNSFWMSVPRFLLGMFPIFFLFALALRARPTLQFTAAFTSILFYALGLIQFVRGWWAH